MQLALSGRIVERGGHDYLMRTDDFIRSAAAIGYRGVELRSGQVYAGMPEDELARVREALVWSGVRCVFLTPDLALESEEGLARFGELLPYADALDALYIRVGVSEPGIPFVQRAADMAGERGRRVICQIHTDSITDSVDSAVAVGERIGRANFGYTYEPGNFVILGLDYGPDALQRLGRYLFHVSFQNIKPVAEASGEGVIAYRGNGFRRCLVGDPEGVDVALVFDGLKQVGYDGFVTVIEPIPEVGMDSLGLARHIHERFAPYA